MFVAKFRSVVMRSGTASVIGFVIASISRSGNRVCQICDQLQKRAVRARNEVYKVYDVIYDLRQDVEQDEHDKAKHDHIGDKDGQNRLYRVVHPPVQLLTGQIKEMVKSMYHRVEHVGEQCTEDKRAEDAGDLSEPAFRLFNVDDSLEDDRRGQNHDDTVNADREIAIVFYEALTFARRCIIARMEAVCGGRSDMVRNRCRLPLCRRWCDAFGACRVESRIRRRWNFCSTGGLCRRYGL